MKLNLWTWGLAVAGVIGYVGGAQADERPVNTTTSAIILGGYVDTSAIWMFGSKPAAGPSLVGRSYDAAGREGFNAATGATTATAGGNRQDNINLNVVKLELSKPLDEGQWVAGYQVGVLFGPDANALASNSQRVNTSDFAIRDANITVRVPLDKGLDLKLGVWESIMSYEHFESPRNPNYSRSFGYAFTPKQHTGLLANYRFTDWLAVSAGIANSASSVINSRSTANDGALKTYMGGVQLNAPESAGAIKGASLDLGVLEERSDNQTSPADATVTIRKNVVQYYAGLFLPTPWERLTLGLCYNYAVNRVFDGSYENALAGYVAVKVTDKLTLHNRAEYAAGSRGAWLVTLPEGDHTRFFGETFTVDYQLWKNAITRAEFRWDHDLSGYGVFNGGTDKNALSVALNVVYQF